MTIKVDQLLTVVLVIKDRPHYTFRWMDYANKTYFPFKILIADGGKDQNVAMHLKDHMHYPNLNYDYLRYPYDASIKDYLNKISNALNQVKTPYVILADDDDFWNVNGIRESIRFLEKNADYSTCRGRNFTFFQNKKNKIKTIYSPHSIFDIENVLASERVMAIYPHLGGTFYDVHRSSQFQTVFKKVAALDFHLMPMIETIISLLDATNGKIKQLECSYLIREDGHGQSTSRSGSYLVRLLTGSCADELTAMCYVVAESVAAHENISVEDFSMQLQNAFIEYLAPVVSNHLYVYHDISLSRVLQNLKSWLIYALEKKHKMIAKSVRSIGHYLLMRKTKKACQQYVKKNPDQGDVFKNINHFLSEIKQ